MIFELLLVVYQVSQSTEEIATIIYMYKWMIFELLLMVYQVSQSTEEISYHYIHV